MRAVWLEVPEAFLAERHRLGHDKLDELWEGVLHMVPPASFLHGSLGTRLVVALTPIAHRRGLIACGDGMGLFDPRVEGSYRIADVSLARPDQVSERGLEGAELVIEVLSPNDESRDKLPFYARVGVREIWLVEPRTRVTELFALRGDRYEPVPFVAGVATSPVLGITLELVPGPRLVLRDGDEVFEI